MHDTLQNSSKKCQVSVKTSFAWPAKGQMMPGNSLYWDTENYSFLRRQSLALIWYSNITLKLWKSIALLWNIKIWLVVKKVQSKLSDFLTPWKQDYHQELDIQIFCETLTGESMLQHKVKYAQSNNVLAYKVPELQQTCWWWLTGTNLRKDARLFKANSVQSQCPHLCTLM